MKIVVFGSNGMLGRYMCSYLHQEGVNVTGYARSDLDIFTEFETGSLASKLENLLDRDTVVINCAGITNKRPDITQQEMYVLNSLFPMFLDASSAKLIHISTDCVFTGKKGNYSCDDPPDEMNQYGFSKRLGERCPNSCIIRTSIIGEEKTSHPSGLLEWVRGSADMEVNGYTNHIWNGVTCLDLAKLIYVGWLKNGYNCPGCLTQITTAVPITKYDLVREISDVYGFNVKVKPFEASTPINKSLVRTIHSSRTYRQQLEELRNFPV